MIVNELIPLPLVVHGTRSNLIPSITEKGLLVPGTSGVKHSTDSGTLLFFSLLKL